MRARTFLAAGALALSLVAIGSAKSWGIMVDSPTRAGTMMLPAGSYSVKLANNQALFTESGSGKKYTVPVKVGQANHKYSDTEVESKKVGDTNVMQRIDLGGTTEQLDFGE